MNRRRAIAVFLVAFVAFAFNLRISFVAVAPVSARLREDLGVGSGPIGLLTSIPVICFGLAAPLALLVIRRRGPEGAVVVTLLAVAIGAVIRSSAGFGAALLGSLIIGLGITVGNIVAPVLIRREVAPRRIGFVTGIYVAGMNVGTMLVTALTVPLTYAVGWRIALAFWGLLALVGLAIWWPLMHRVRTPATAPATSARTAVEPARPLWRTPIAWVLAIGFGAQSASYYSITAWLPAILGDEIGLSRATAGGLASIFQICGIVGGFVVPVLALRLPPWGAIGVIGALWITCPALLLIQPEAYLVAVVCGGIAQGGGFAALLTAVAHIADSDRASARLSAFMQGIGYVVAAGGPPLLGLTHDVTSAWTVPILIAVGTTCTFAVMGVTAGVAAERARAQAS